MDIEAIVKALNLKVRSAADNLTAIIEGYGYTTTVQTAAGSSTYSITVPKATGVSYEGKAVTFRVGSATAIQTSAWAMGDNVLVNLIASTP